MKSFLVLIAFTVFFVSCSKKSTREYKATITVVNFDGKPLAGRKVKAFVTPFDARPFEALKEVTSQNIVTTDNNGKAVLEYELWSDDGSHSSVSIVALDDSSLISTNYIGHDIFNTVEHFVGGTITMDSLIPFKIQFKSNYNIAGIKSRINIANQFRPKNDKILERIFLELDKNISTNTLDTTITTMVYSKNPFKFQNSIKLANNTYIHKNVITVTDSIDRRKIFLAEF